jgi:hypothetical protein
MQFIQQIKTMAQQETPAERRQRMLPGTIYGLLIATAYALVGSIVNQLSFPDLPVGVDWRNLLITWSFFAVWLGVGGAFINWFTQTEESMVTGLFVMALIALGAGALTLEGNLPAQFGKLLLLALPVMAISLVMTITLRWLGVRHAEVIEREQTLKTKSIAILMVIALTIGGLTGLGLTRWGDSTLSAARYVHERLQTLVVEPVQAEGFFPLNDVPGLVFRLGMPYTLHGKPSGQSVTAAQVTVEFKDGYRITCVLLVFPDTTPFLRACAEGYEVNLPDNQ